MAFPSGVTLVTLTGNNLLDLEGNSVVSGLVWFKASGQLADPTHGFIVVDFYFSTSVLNGVMAPVELPVNDATLNPNGFTITVRQEFYYLKPDGSLSKTPVLRIYNLSLDSSYLPTVDLADIAPVSAFTPVNGITVVGTGSVNQVLTNLGNQTAGWRNSSGGGGSGTVTSVNNISPDGAGNVALTAAEVGADPSGAAGAAQTVAIAAAATSAAGLYLPLAGGSLSGSLVMGGHKVTGGAAASEPTDLPIFSQIPTAGTGAGNYAAGNDSRISGALQASNNFGDVPNPGTARNNLGLYVQDSPIERGWSEWNFAPLPQNPVSQNLTSGSVYGVLFKTLSGLPFSKVGVHVISAASTPVAGQNLIGYYEVSGSTATQKGQTADLGSWSGSDQFEAYSIGNQSPALGTTVILLFVSNAATPVHVNGVTSDTAAQLVWLNLGLSSVATPWVRFFLYGTGLTALPGSFAMSGATLGITNALAPWACLL